MGVRYYPATYTRFLSQDPVAFASPKELLVDPQQLNTYSYARNNPMIAIDPDGQLTVIIPGTGYNSSQWSSINSAGSDFANRVSNTFNETHSTQIINDKNIWSGANNPEARQKAADFVSNFISNYSFAEGEKLNLVGHSHGGNIANLVSQNTAKKIDNLVTLGTPVRSDYQPNYDNTGNHVNAYSNFDVIQKMGGGGTSISELAGRSLFGRIGGWLGSIKPFYEFGPAGRQFNGAINVNVSKGSNIFNAHSSLWRDSKAWNKVSDSLK